MMKRMLCIAVFVVVLLFSSCSTDIKKPGNSGETQDFEVKPTNRGISEGIDNETLINDVIDCDSFDFVDNSLEVTEFSIIKRQTNIEEKTDFVWVSIKAKNLLYQIERNFKMTYILYNEGWLLEEFDVYSDSKHSDHILPLQSIEQESLDYYTSFEFLSSVLDVAQIPSWPNAVHHFGYLNTGHDGPYMADQNSFDIYYITTEYEYETVTERVTIPIRLDFANNDDGAGWHWVPSVITNDAVRSIVFNSGILGTWTSKFSGGVTLYGNELGERWFEMTISDYGDDWCYIDSYTYTYPYSPKNSRIEETRSNTTEGKLKFCWSFDKYFNDGGYNDIAYTVSCYLNNLSAKDLPDRSHETNYTTYQLGGLEYSFINIPLVWSEGDGAYWSDNSNDVPSVVKNSCPSPIICAVDDPLYLKIFDRGDLFSAHGYSLVNTRYLKSSSEETSTTTPVPTQTPQQDSGGNVSAIGGIDDGETIGKIVIIVDALRVRSSPSTSGEEVAKTTMGEEFRVFEISHADGYTWYRIGKNAWIADINSEFAAFSQNNSPTDWDLDASLGTIEILVDTVQMRKAPSIRAEKTIWTAKGDKYWVYEISYAESSEGYLWYKIGPDAWVLDTDGKSIRYSNRIDLLIAQAQGVAPDQNDPTTFRGHTLGEVIKAFGDGYKTNDFGCSEPYPGLFYPDNRTPYVFLYVDAYEKLGGRQIDQSDLDMDFVVADVGILSEIEAETIYGIAEYQNWIFGDSGSSSQNAATLNTDFYSVTIPAAINAKCVSREHWDGISLYEITSVLDGCGGNFFSLVMYAADDFSFLDNPTIVSYQGMLTAQNGERYNLFFCQPTDVQWSSTGYDNFAACSDCAEEILASLRPLNGVTLTKPKELNPQSKQVVFVSTYEYNGQYGARLCVAEWKDEAWKTRLSDIVASIGSNGTTTDKHEGDHCTPSGTFNILFCFSDRTLETGLRQKTLRDGDVWVTDQNSRYYNTIQADSARYKDWTKSENIYRQLTSGRSVAGIFFDYNGDGETAGSATPGAGAALFLDGVGSSGDLYTGYGDIKLTGEDLLQLLKVLDSSLNPVIIIDSAD